ncbi:MAG TPA: SEC-C metal-binding domain-containing protein [Candidatus Eisenbacteria bacterium]|nr:SEC-C metal-binding domain-containing protein [Candidatus Eisenbacteria bacterium]
MEEKEERRGFAPAIGENPRFGCETGRNDPCCCGRGKEYKKCHGQ